MSSFESRSSSWVDEDDPNGFFVPDEERVIKDIIHDLIPINSYLNRFIDTEPFQRLRDIKQLGTSSYVWPGASHTRFEHCLGVAYLARCLASHLQTNQKDLKITDRDVGCVEIAGLCHDLGHGPWSHVWDGIFMPLAEKNCRWKHEFGSEMMFDYLVQTNDIPISDKDIRFIKALIAGDPSRCDPSEKVFLFDIISNKRNGLDVDKFDYIQRDSRMTGESFSFPATRILKSARVLDNQICYNIKDANQIYGICQRRFELHKHVYNHKTARAIEYMIVDALLKADPHMKISQRVYDPESFLHLTDFIMKEIEMSRDPELEESRQILKRIRRRDLYRCVDFTTVEFSSGKAVEKHMTAQRIFEKAIALRGYSEDENGDFKAEDIVVDISMMHYGMKEHNPVDFTKFYHKRTKGTSMNAGPGDYSGLRPAVHAEILLRIYTKNPKYYGWVQRGYREALKEMNDLVAKGELDESNVSHERNGDTRPTTPVLDRTLSSIESDDTPGSSTSQGLPKTPGSDGSGPAGKRKKRAFKKTPSTVNINNFTTVPPDYSPNSPLVRPRQVSTGVRDQQSASRRDSGQLDTTLSPFVLPSALPVSGDPLLDLFDDSPHLSTVPPEGRVQGPADPDAGRKDVGASRPLVDPNNATQARAQNFEGEDELMPFDAIPIQVQNSTGAGLKRGREDEPLTAIDDANSKRRKERVE